MNDQNTNRMFDIDMTDIDLRDLILLFVKKIWLIIIAMILSGALTFTVSMFAIEPEYTATAMLYVNNSALSFGGASLTISSSELSAARSLLDVYIIILRSRTTLEAAIEKADLDYTYSQLRGIVTAASVNKTEIFTISATCNSPDEAKLIVDTLVDILPDRISDIVDGSSVRLVDRAVRSTSRSNPSNSYYAMIGAGGGAIIAFLIIVVLEMMKTTVRDEGYLRQRYDIPILAVVPDVYAGSKKSYYKREYKYAYKRYYGKSAAKGYYAAVDNDNTDISGAEDGDSK